MLQTPVATQKHFEQGNLLLVYRELPADFETPASVYLKLAGENPSFLLESITGGEQLARYSFIGVDLNEAFVIHQNQVVHHKDVGIESYPLLPGKDPLLILREYLDSRKITELEGLPRFIGGLVGYLGYNMINYFEPKVALNYADSLPEGIYLITNKLVAFDHAFGKLLLISIEKMNSSRENALKQAEGWLDDLEQRLMVPLPYNKDAKDLTISEGFESNIEVDKYKASVESAKEYIRAGDIFQVVLSQRLSRKTEANPFDIYRSLRRLNPSPYMFFFNFGHFACEEQFHLIGASPELHVRLENEVASLRPIAGTRKRGKNEAKDSELEKDLLSDPKECAEHIMLVDLGRNDLGRVCEYGSVDVKELMVIERYSHVMHMVSQVEGKLRSGLDGFDLMTATFPAGTVSGAPKIRAMQIIKELEPDSRGPYAGAVGYFSYDGSMDSCITIRTLIMQGDQISVQAGAGIVADSEPQREYEETLNKARALAEAVVLSERGS
ncbi:MAG: anthranilate synthase component I [Anaerolineales bacterium]|jgi:anthranilate synthase component 1